MKKALLSLLLTLTSLFAQANGGESKLAMIFVYQDGCGWCEKMEREIFDDPKKMAKIAKHYSFQKLNKTDPALPAFLHPNFFPTTYILSPDRKRVVDELPGYMKPDQFLDYVNELYDVEMR